MKHDIQAADHGPLGPAMADAVSTCVHCGFCLAACPTYRELGQETDSPRGRIVLMKEALEGKLPIDDAMPHVDRCLGCLACEPACPSGVAYGELISPFRAIASDKRKRGLVARIKRMIVSSTLPYPGRFYLAATVGRIFKPLAQFLPTTPRSMLELLPDELPRRSAWKAAYKVDGKPRARVALLTGCAQSVLDPDINTATITVLKRNGVEVVVPQNQVCCGALSWHVGKREQAQSFAKQNIDAFPSDVDAIVTNAAGCGSGMRDYELICKGTPSEDAAKELSKRVVDVSVFLADLGDLAPFESKLGARRIAYHDACHLANAQGVRSQPRSLLRSIPNAEIVEIHDAHYCCGSAGTYNIDQPTIAASLGQQKSRRVIETQADIVASGNIGCLTQLKLHLEKQGSEIQVKHTMQVLRDAYAGKL